MEAKIQRIFPPFLKCGRYLLDQPAPDVSNSYFTQHGVLITSVKLHGQSEQQRLSVTLDPINTKGDLSGITEVTNTFVVCVFLHLYSTSKRISLV